LCCLFIKYIFGIGVVNAVFIADTVVNMDISPMARVAGVLVVNGLIYRPFPLEEQWRVNKAGVLLGLGWLLPLMSKPWL